MTIPYIETKVYDWFEIQAEICKRLGITEHQFTDLLGWSGSKPDEVEYQNLWHEFLEDVIPEKMRNDTWVKMYKIDEGWFPKAKPWAVPAYIIYNQIMDEIDTRELGVIVKFSW
jgi:hypothetical protein